MTIHHRHALAAFERMATSDPSDLGEPMADNKSRASMQERRRINLKGADEVRNWTEILGVTEEELRKAIAAVGSEADKVREHLRKK
jgi:hypothetical protein